MDNIDKYIDKLFEEKLSNASLNPNVGGKISSNEWMRISRVIRKKSFLKFSWYSFNIYYLSSIIVATTIASFIVAPNLFSKKERIEESVQIEKNESHIAPDSRILKPASDTLIINSEMNEKEVFQDSLKKQDSQKIREVIDKKVVNVADSLDIKGKVKENVIKESSVDRSKELKEKDSIVDGTINRELIVQPDTIINIDTVRITKKRLLFKRKK